ncbi:alkene reductase [Vibrio parahaemolyticus]|nr:alkene reductase [Vibrio parahaemolyticus]WMN90555.1 alkene reductase [Vibrio parahaemolyticus]WMO08215.1 alkene reductase [Vibrio parahaemolyticus]
MYTPLFEPVKLGHLTLNNRVIFPPLTRSRSSQPGNIPNELMAEYYAQRVSAGLLITEASQIEPRGQGYAWTPGIHSEDQVEGWKVVTEKVHKAGGKIFLQLWHVGRVSHNSFQPDGQAPVAPSAIRADAVKVFIETAPGEGALAEPSMPRALLKEEIEELVDLYAQAAENAMNAGFDGVEIHAANGYLINQFMSEHTNKRTDEYGGSLENRLRFLKQVTQAVVDTVGADKVGVRFAPLFESTDEERIYLGLVESDPFNTYITAAKALNDMNIAYLSIAEADWENAPRLPEEFCQALREVFRGVIMYAGKYTADKALYMLNKGYGDIFGFGRSYIANPDLPERILKQNPLNPLKADLLFGGGAEGYTDYLAYQK